MLLLDLPNENLSLILACIERADIVSVALCCRHLRSLSEWRLLQLRYGKIEVGNRPEERLAKTSKPQPTPRGILCDVLSNPSIIPHVFVLSFCGYYYECCKTESNISPATSRGIREALVRSECLDANEIETYYEAILVNHDQAAAFALLLTLLFNLKEIELSTIPGFRTEEMVSRIAEHTHEQGGPHALSNLTKVTLKGFHPDDDRLQIATSFAQLPSVRTLFGGFGLGSREIGRDLWSRGPRTSGVEVVHASESRIEPRHFSAFFAGIRNLREFQLKAPGVMLRECNLIRETLLRYARDTLETLAIAGSPYKMPEPSIGSLRAFEVLRNITLAFVHFIDNGIPQRLIDILPASAVSLTVREAHRPNVFHEEFGYMPDNDLVFPDGAGLFADLLEYKCWRLPDLEAVRYYGHVELDVKTTCQAAGIAFHCLDSTSHSCGGGEL